MANDIPGFNADDTDNLEEAKKAAKQFKEELAEIEKQYDSHEKQMERIKQVEKELRDARLAQNDAREKELKRELALLEEATRAVNEFKKAQDELNSTFLDMQGSMGKLTGIFGDFGSATVGIVQDAQNYNKILEKDLCTKWIF